MQDTIDKIVEFGYLYSGMRVEDFPCELNYVSPFFQQLCNLAKVLHSNVAEE
jgi:hypothetical protein